MQKRTHNINACTIAIACLFIFGSCKQLKMFSHTEKATDTYCIYKISDVKNTGTTQALKKGDVICLYCRGPFTCLLYTKQWIKVYDVQGGDPWMAQIHIRKDIGISYYLETDDPAASCTSCPAINKFELLPN